MFVFALCGFHTYIICLGLTTQEKLKHIFDRFPTSPFTKGFTRNWSKVICCPKVIPSRISHELYLKTNKPEEFEKLKRSLRKRNIPSEIEEKSVVIYSNAFKKENRF